MKQLINQPKAKEHSELITKYFSEDNNKDLSIELKYNENGHHFSVKTITLQVTEDCNLACSYCYQHHKTNNFMNFETAKLIIDSCLADEDIQNKLGIILDFIGGEPFLNIDVIDKITEYFFKKLSEIDIQMLSRSMISICSNGLLYHTAPVQKYIKKYQDFLSFSISIDGYKELHDSCRRTPAGEPSYDIAVNAAKHFMQNYGSLGTKMTFAKENIEFASKGVINLIELGYKDIHCNCAFEPLWDIEDAKLLYSQFKIIADYIINNNLETEIFCSMFDTSIGQPKDYSDPANDKNWCGGAGDMLAADYKGDWYPCLRYMKSAIGDKQPLLKCGNIETGINHDILKEMQKVTLTSQSTDECIYCPISSGCAWCSAYNYEVHGTINKRVTNICIMHKARSLINTYFYNKIYKKHNITDRLEIFLPKEEAIKIISEKEYNMLVTLKNQ